MIEREEIKREVVDPEIGAVNEIRREFMTMKKTSSQATFTHHPLLRYKTHLLSLHLTMSITGAKRAGLDNLKKKLRSQRGTSFISRKKDKGDWKKSSVPWL